MSNSNSAPTDYSTVTIEGVHIFAAMHDESVAGPACISIAVGSGHSELSGGEARSIGELLIRSADAIERQPQRAHA